MSNALQKAYSLYQQMPESLKRPVRKLAQGCRPWMAKRALSDEQLQFWDEHGYLILEGFVSPENVARLNNLVDELWATRAQRSDMPFVVDACIGTEQEHRVRLRDAGDELRAQPYKLYDLYLEYPFVRSIVQGALLADMLNTLLDGESVLCGTINFEWGSQQELHFDSMYMMPAVRNKLVATWIALEDIHEDSGPLRYVPGSHKIPPYIFEKSGTTAASHEEMPLVRKYIADQCEELGLREQMFTGNAGDVFIWHAQLLHGGVPRRDTSRTRKSLVSHYWRCQDISPESIARDEPWMNYLNRNHHLN